MTTRFLRPCKYSHVKQSILFAGSCSGRGLLRRELGQRGKLVNYVVGDNHVEQTIVTVCTRRTFTTGLTEDEIKKTIAEMLERQGWTTKIAWGKSRGIDIDAVRAHERWIIECKGSGSRPEMQNNYFIGAVGELLQRMQDESSKHSIAFPDLPKFRRLWSELPGSVKHRLQLTALFVTNEGVVQELKT